MVAGARLEPMTSGLLVTNLVARNPEVVFLFLPFISGDTAPDSKARSVEPVCLFFPFNFNYFIPLAK